MEIKIGMQDVTREITLQTSETAADIEARLTKAIADHGVFRLTTEAGGLVLIPASVIAYVDLGQEHARQVGFGSM